MRQATANKRVRALLTAMQGRPIYALDIAHITGTSLARCYEALTAAGAMSVMTGPGRRVGFALPEIVDGTPRIHAVSERPEATS